jgi:hypothetical protein
MLNAQQGRHVLKLFTEDDRDDDGDDDDDDDDRISKRMNIEAGF